MVGHPSGEIIRVRSRRGDVVADGQAGRPQRSGRGGARPPVLGGSLRVPWADLDPGTYENLVATMLSREHPTARRVDGSGGDGGCDVAFPTASGEEVFELKSWTGRVTDSRRSQLKRSLDRARGRKPVAWNAVVPVDLTPKEQEWFDRLAAGVPFPCHWRGRTWFDGMFAEYRPLVRYFCGSGSDEMVEAFRDFTLEQAALAGGLSDGVERLRVLAGRIDDLSPFHRVRVTVDGDDVFVGSRPRYPGADDDAPLTIKATFVFPPTDDGRAAAERLRGFLDYGEPVEVGPEYVEAMEFSELLAGPDGPGTFLFSGGGDQEIDIGAVVEVVAYVDGEDEVVASMPVRFAAARGGGLGATATGADASGALTVTVVLDKGAGRTSVNFRFDPSGVMPQAALAACNLLGNLVPGRAVAVRLDGDAVVGPFRLDGDIGGFVGTASLVTDLDQLQRRTGHLFATPSGLTLADHEDIREALALLDGDVLTEPWTDLTLEGLAGTVPDLLDAVHGGGSLVAMSRSDLDLGGHLVPLGVLARTFDGAVPADAAGVRETAARADPGSTIPVRFVPSGEAVATVSRVGDRWPPP